MAGHVERGVVTGLVMAVTTGRRNAHEVHVDALGVTALDGGPMRSDTIFHIASMTKPVVAVPAMMLVEDGVLHLDDPIDLLLPELAARPVLVRRSGTTSPSAGCSPTAAGTRAADCSPRRRCGS